MTLKEYFDKYLWCGKLNVGGKTGCGANDWNVYTCKVFPPFLKEIVCNKCGIRHLVVVRDLAPKGKICIERSVIERIKKIAKEREADG